MGKRPERSAADHSLRWTVWAREWLGGKESWMAARRRLARRDGGREATGPRQEGGIFGWDEDMPLRSKSKCPNEVDKDRGDIWRQDVG